MKTKSIVFAVLAVGFMACGGGTKPGSGANFNSSITAAELFEKVTFKPYIPSKLIPDDKLLDGTADCIGGGEVTITNKSSGDKINSHIVYDGCVSDRGYKHDGYEDVGMDRDGFSVVQNDSLSGEFGFAANCDFAVKFTTAGGAVTGSGCTYTDASGKTLELTAADLQNL